MMMTEQTIMPNGNGKSPMKTAIQMLIGGAFGLAAIWVVDTFVGLDTVLNKKDLWGAAAFGLAMIFALMAVIVFVMSFSRKLLTYNKSSADMGTEEFAELQPLLRWSSISILLVAASFMLLVLARAGDTPQWGYFWGALGAMALQTGISVYVWQRQDELYRDVARRAANVTLIVSQLIVFVWAAANIAGGVAFDPLGVLVTITAIYTIAAIWITAAKGMME